MIDIIVYDSRIESDISKVFSPPDTLGNGEISGTIIYVVRHSHLFRNTPEFWMKAQRVVDLWTTEKENKKSAG